MPSLNGKTILITGAARRIGRLFALACARAGADIILHHAHSDEEAKQVKDEIESIGRNAHILASNFGTPDSVSRLISSANDISPLYALVNNAAIFEPLSFQTTSLEDWNRHFNINLTAPFLLSQAFAKHLLAPAAEDGGKSNLAIGRIVNILDWRALRPAADHFPYTVSKAALAAMTKSLAVALAPRITVNGLALGAILPPSDEPSAGEKIIESVPAKRWSEAGEVEEALLFLLSGPSYITGEIIHVDGGRHLI
ncbi:MAG: SDR family oxidoreductase [Chloroflexi bacterium]|nr:SDR family oxidoreductase [Chloroflexota bacterium]